MAKKKQEYQATTGIQRVISLNKGRGAYVINPKGKLNRYDSRHSPEFAAAIEELNDEMNGFGDRELARLGWDMPEISQADPAG